MGQSWLSRSGKTPSVEDSDVEVEEIKSILSNRRGYIDRKTMVKHVDSSCRGGSCL